MSSGSRERSTPHVSMEIIVVRQSSMLGNPSSGTSYLCEENERYHMHRFTQIRLISVQENASGPHGHQRQANRLFLGCRRDSLESIYTAATTAKKNGMSSAKPTCAFEMHNHPAP